MSNKNYILFLAITVSLFSCVGAKKMQQVTEKLGALQTQQTEEKDKIATIASLGEAKLAERKIDSNISIRLQQRLSVVQLQLDSVNKEITALQNLSTDKKTFRNAYKKEILPRLAELDSFYKKYEERMKVFVMLQDGVNTADYVLFDLAAFFGPGLYNIPSEQEQLAIQSFLPLVDSLVSFSNRYQDTKRTATLVILGFADGQNISPGSALYDTLSNMLGTTSADKELLNKKLSELRALELIKQLTILFKQKAGEIKSSGQLNVEYIGQGKGEEYPIPSIKDYKEDDERRRIVLCYWAVLPDMQ